MTEGKLLIQREKDGVARVIINNPERRNALDVEIREEMARAFDELHDDSTVRAIVLSGRGEHFCAGGDIKEWKDFTALEARDRLRKIHKPLRKIIQIPKPVIAMVRGYAVGAGMNFVLACDVVFASEDAKFAQTFVRLGIIPDAGGLCLLPLAVGLHRAKELMFSAELIDARRAHEMGFVNRVLPTERLEEETTAFARKLAGGPPIAIGMIKKIVNLTFLHQLEHVLEHEAHAQPFCFQTEDHREGKSAFLEKRPPTFSGR